MTTTQDRNRDHLHQRFRTPLERWLTDVRAWCQGRGLDALVYETFRTAERQAWLYASGRTRPGPILTYTLDSSHEYGGSASHDFSNRTPCNPEFVGELLLRNSPSAIPFADAAPISRRNLAA